MEAKLARMEAKCEEIRRFYYHLMGYDEMDRGFIIHNFTGSGMETMAGLQPYMQQKQPFIRYLQQPMYHFIDIPELQMALEDMIKIYEMHLILKDLQADQLLLLREMFPPPPMSHDPVLQLQYLSQLLTRVNDHMLLEAYEIYNEEGLEGYPMGMLEDDIMLYEPVSKEVRIQQVLQLDQEDFHMIPLIIQLFQCQMDQLLVMKAVIMRYYDELLCNQLIWLLSIPHFPLVRLLELIGDIDMKPAPQPIHFMDTNYEILVLTQCNDVNVYKRYLKPHPVVEIRGPSHSPLFLCLHLMNRSNNERMDQYLKCPERVEVYAGDIITLDKVMILTTSKKNRDCTFILQVEVVNDQNTTLASIETIPFTIVSHTSMLRKYSTVTASQPSSTWTLIPPKVTYEQRSHKFCVLGDQFIASPSLLIVLEGYIIIPQVKSDKCITFHLPRHLERGTYGWRVITSLDDLLALDTMTYSHHLEIG